MTLTPLARGASGGVLEVERIEFVAPEMRRT
jgi:hypothetical protein